MGVGGDSIDGAPWVFAVDRQHHSSEDILPPQMEMAKVLDTLISKVNLAVKLEDPEAVPMKAEDLAIYDDDSTSCTLLYSVTGSLADQCRSVCKGSVCQVYLLQKSDLQRKPSSVLDFVRAKARWAKQGCASRAPAAATAADAPAQALRRRLDAVHRYGTPPWQHKARGACQQDHRGDGMDGAVIAGAGRLLC